MERAASAEVKFWVNGKEAATGTARSTVPAGFTVTETLDVGIDLNSHVAEDYFDKVPFKFEGTPETAPSQKTLTRNPLRMRLPDDD